ncbi:hypothetical protein [Cohnella panacarvi]|uniref:hypothetical protein n=1 Tax=Cohnella panacarvi TaxID=400776 RepID=UPI00146FBF52|nr:hypothetical protein [Cohnella panacarvi]
MSHLLMPSWFSTINLKRYAEEYSREYLKQQNELEKQLEAHYQDKAYAQAIAREIMMRGD